MKKLIYFSCSMLLLGCGGGDDNPTPHDMDNVAPTDPENREIFFNESIAHKAWKLNRFVFDDTTRFFKDSTLVENLFEVLPQCRKDITYKWSYSSGIVYIDYIDPQPCNPDEDTMLDEGLILRNQGDDFLISGEAEFKGQWDAVNKLLNIDAGGPGITGWNDFDMRWNSILLAKDSVNIEGSFPSLNRDNPLPGFSLQFVPD